MGDDVGQLSTTPSIQRRFHCHVKKTTTIFCLNSKNFLRRTYVQTPQQIRSILTPLGSSPALCASVNSKRSGHLSLITYFSRQFRNIKDRQFLMGPRRTRLSRSPQTNTEFVSLTNSISLGVPRRSDRKKNTSILGLQVSTIS